MENISLAKQMYEVAYDIQIKEADRESPKIIELVRSEVKRAAFAGKMRVTVSIYGFSERALQMATNVIRRDGFKVTTQSEALVFEGNDPKTRVGLEIYWGNF